MTLTVHPSTAKLALNILRDTRSWFESLEFNRRNLGGDSHGTPRLRFFFPPSFSFYSCREAYLSVCSVSQQHPDSHSHSYTRSHLGAAEYNRKSAAEEPHRGDDEGGEASL